MLRFAPGTPGGFRVSTIAVLFVLLMAAAALPIATHPLPPLSDYPNHLARMHVIDALGADPYLSRFYTVEWQLIPNLMMDLIIPLLHRFMDVYLAGQIFTVLAFVLIGSGTLAFNRALTGRWSALPLIALPLLYNGVLLVGVMNYVFGIGLALWALAAWVALRERAWPWRFAALRAVCARALCLPLVRARPLRSRPAGAGIAPAVAGAQRTVAAAPCSISVRPACLSSRRFALLLASPTWHADGVAAYWELTGKLGGLFAAVNVYYPAVAVALVGAAALAAIYARRRGALRFHPAGWAILGVGLVTYMAMPRALFGAYLADQRLPIALAFMLIACFEIDLRSRRARGGLLALLVVLLAARVTEVQLVWDHLARITGEFRQSVETIKRGSRVLVVFGDRSAFKDVSDFEIVHAASLATIERSALVTTLFTVRGKQIMHARKEFQKYVETEDHWPPSLPYVLQVADGDKATSSYFWNDWPAHYDYVYILFATPGFRNPDRNHLGLAYSGDAFQLYRVLPTLAVNRHHQ